MRIYLKSCLKRMLHESLGEKWESEKEEEEVLFGSYGECALKEEKEFPEFSRRQRKKETLPIRDEQT